jgi:hypothetical protein
MESISYVHYIILTVCQVDKMAPEGAREKNIIIKGPADAVEAAKRLISEKIGGDPYGTVRSLPLVRYR